MKHVHNVRMYVLFLHDNYISIYTIYIYLFIYTCIKWGCTTGRGPQTIGKLVQNQALGLIRYMADLFVYIYIHTYIHIHIHIHIIYWRMSLYTDLKLVGCISWITGPGHDPIKPLLRFRRPIAISPKLKIRLNSWLHWA